MESKRLIPYSIGETAKPCRFNEILKSPNVSLGGPWLYVSRLFLSFVSFIAERETSERMKALDIPIKPISLAEMYL